MNENWFDKADHWLNRAVDRVTPWVIGFTVFYLAIHVLVAVLKGKL